MYGCMCMWLYVCVVLCVWCYVWWMMGDVVLVMMWGGGYMWICGVGGCRCAGNGGCRCKW